MTVDQPRPRDDSGLDCTKCNGKNKDQRPAAIRIHGRLRL